VGLLSIHETGREFPRTKMADVVERRHESHRLLKARRSLVSLLDKPRSSSKLVYLRHFRNPVVMSLRHMP
jgi:hypothetical protein